MLYPKSAELIDHNIKFQEVYMSLAEDIAEKLSENWRQRFCKYIPLDKQQRWRVCKDAV